MKKYQRGCLLFFSLQLLFNGAVLAAAIKSSYHWKGFYVGATAGGVFAHFNTNTSTQAGPLLDAAQADAVNNVGNQTINTKGFLSGIEAGYNWQFNRLLLGLETDIQSLSISGDTISGAIPYPNSSSQQFVITSYGNNNWLLTARPRVGFIANNWLFYATGGLGLTLLQSDFIFSNNSGEFESKRVSRVKSGYVIGAGVETGITNHVSVKAEYLFENFNNIHAANMNHNVPAGQTFSNFVNLKSNIIKLGINYRFDDQSDSSTDLQFIPDLLDSSQWDTEIGARLFLSSGIAGAPQPLLNYSPMGNLLASRLTFSDLSAISGETFARAEHVSGFFAKGYLGAGSITNGHLNDEDFPAGGAYSNTISDALGNLSYATIDLGYSFLKTPHGKTGVFIGYNYYAQNINIYGCKQLAGASVCVPSSELADFIALSEDDKINSARLGFSSQFDLTNRLTLTSETAYLPAINFNGLDYHNARQLIGPEHSSRGDGAMLESVLEYQFANSWNIGLGGRYWMWNMHSGSVLFDFLGQNLTIPEPARFNTERYGVFLQLSYRDKKFNDIDFAAEACNWKGIFIGGQLGGAWGNNDWSDPFGATPADPGFTNVAGFGDKISATGPLGGVDVGFNWQTGQWVYGIEGNISVADVRGENTVFSGLGGLNAQAIINYLGTMVGRVGTTLNRSLLYITAGPAWLNTTYRLNGNTTVLTLGSDSDTSNNWGWTGGVGIEYALTNHWSTSVEYDYIRIPGHVISFPSVQIINNNRINANQTMNVFKLGLNYKFDMFA